jgi:hypothetical protein
MNELEDELYIWTYIPEKKIIETIMGFKVSINY